MPDKVIISDEKQFVHRDAFNKGYVQIPSMVENCIGLSNHAKTVYSNILNHVYEKGHAAFPSTYRLAIACSCSVNSVINYINELVDKGFIEKESRGRGKSNFYYVREVHEVPLLRVSEMFWKCMSKLTHTYGWKDIMQAKEKILKFMGEIGYVLQDMETDEESMSQLTELLKYTMKGGTIEVGLLPKNMKFQKSVDKGPSKSNISTAHNGHKTKKTVRTVPVGIKNNHWALMDLSEWGVEQFKEYYYDKYLNVTEQPHPRNIKKHTGIMRRLVNSVDGKNELLKQYIDSVFEIGYDNMTLDYMSATRVGEIQTFISTGKRPFYLENKNPKERVVDDVLVKPTNISSDDMLKRMLGGGE